MKNAEYAACSSGFKVELEKLLKAATTLKIMSNPSRLAILCYLLQGELQVSQLMSLIKLSQSALSQHLALLRENDLVVTRREEQRIFYSLKSDEVRAIIGALKKIYC